MLELLLTTYLAAMIVSFIGANTETAATQYGTSPVYMVGPR